MSIPLFARSQLVAAASLAVVLALGCNSAKPARVTGKLILPERLKLAETDSITILFVPEEEGKGKSTSASVNPSDMTFSGEVAPGKYKIGVTITPYAGPADSEARAKAIDAQLGPFNAGATSLRYEVTNDSSQSFTVDLSKAAITKN